MDRYIGKLLDNRYELLEIVGTGGMAVVYKALCHRLNRYVAVKILKDEHLVDAEFRRRFHDEAQAVAMLSHPNIVSVYDVSSTKNTEYIVMELIDGISLKEYLKKKGALSWKETLYFSTQIAKALSHAHKRGIIHRDIKPQNIMLLSDGTIKVADFGIARLMEQRNQHFTQEALGSVHYVAPEQAKGSYIDARADLYSLGVVMYEMETGRLPFEGDTPVAVALQHINAIPLMPREVKTDIPPALEEITMKAMNPSLSRRYASADDMLIDLEKFRLNPQVAFSYRSEQAKQISPEDDLERTQKIEIPLSKNKFHAKNEDNTPLQIKKSKIPFFNRRRSPKEGDVMNRPMALGLIFATAFLIGAMIFAWILINPGGNAPQAASGVVPNLVGKNYANEISLDDTLKDYKFDTSNQEYNDTVPEGNVISQQPTAGSAIKKGDTIYLTLSRGAQKSQLPDVSGLEYRQAELQLKNLGFVFKEDYEKSDETLQGYVIRTEPSKYSDVKTGDEITVVISLGKDIKRVKVPNVIGMTESQAKTALESAGLLLGKVDRQQSQSPVGEVIEQKIPAQLEIDEKTAVDIVLSSGSTSSGTDTSSTDTGGSSGSTTPVKNTKTVSETIVLPSDPENQHVVIKLNGNTVYDQNKKASDQQVTVTLTGSGSGYMTVYVNNKLTYEKVILFN
ncbi:MAG: Stk1 family PASTA domain-containing Ser/Thr kinase [Clostridiales bacterium]|nr:Stk1 family PASTA domain-containing Ser/Thr kinase [Clostridiales bacterium]